MSTIPPPGSMETLRAKALKMKDVSVQTDPVEEESDPEYEPSTEVDEEDDDDDYDEEEENPREELQHMPFFVIMQPSAMAQLQRVEQHESEEESLPESRKRSRDNMDERDFVQYFTREEKAYWRTLDSGAKRVLLQHDKDIKTRDTTGKTPLRFKLLSSPMDAMSKALILAKLEQFQQMNEGSGEYYKLRNWLNAVSRLPLGNFCPLKVKPTDPSDVIRGYLTNVRKRLDDTVYGHQDTKDQIMRIMAQWVSNPSSKGNVIGIHGAPGIGKTKIIKEGVCKALGLPFGFIALGGASDGAFLEGHSFTYEGSIHGKIADILMKTQCMNPVIFFDELDKVSSTRRGDEIIGILTHLTDTTQNERFQDRYFGDIDLDLSKALIVFSYNDESLINPILKDRMVTIHVKGYNMKEKLKIATDYLLPEVLEQYGLTNQDLIFPPHVIERIIDGVDAEQGVRNLKRGLDAIVSWINMQRYVPSADGGVSEFPFTVTEEHVQKYIHKSASSIMKSEVAHMMYM